MLIFLLSHIQAGELASIYFKQLSLNSSISTVIFNHGAFAQPCIRVYKLTLCQSLPYTLILSMLVLAIYYLEYFIL